MLAEAVAVPTVRLPGGGHGQERLGQRLIS